MNYTFGKEYKLCRKKMMDSIFAKNKAVKKFPFVLLYEEVEEVLPKPFQVVISVPKKYFKRAVDRNRTKRLMREVIRLEKHPLEELLIQNKKYLALFWVYTSNEQFELDVLRKKFQKMIQNLIEKIDEKNI